MTHHHTPPPDPMPLDPEERALAARLARLGPHGEPSPALDARVLAAAHAATAGGADRGGRERGWRRARWPVGAGVAASLALAATIAWQMRPLPAPVVSPDDPAARAPADIAAADASAPAAAPSLRMLSGPPPVPEAPPVVFDAPSPVAEVPPAKPMPLPPPLPPPPPPAPPAPPVAAAPAPVAVTAPAPPVADADEADDPGAPDTEVPPATVASPQVRGAWLARIRELVAAGREDEARASLAEFQRRYPAFAVPQDLRPLLLPEAPQPQPQPPLPAPPR